MKYITKNILCAYDNEEDGAEDKLSDAFKLYLKEKVPVLKQSQYASRYLGLLDYHFHDCQVLKLSYDEREEIVVFAFDGGLKPYDESGKGNKLSIGRIEFFKSYILSEIKLPFAFHSEKNNYTYIYADEFDFEDSTLYSKFSFICDSREVVEIYFHSIKFLMS